LLFGIDYEHYEDDEMKYNLARRLETLEEGSRPRVLRTLADFVVWRAKWKRGIEEEVEIDPVLENALRKLSQKE
jgi:hypothetical protein